MLKRSSGVVSCFTLSADEVVHFSTNLSLPLCCCLMHVGDHAPQTLVSSSQFRVCTASCGLQDLIRVSRPYSTWPASSSPIEGRRARVPSRTSRISVLVRTSRGEMARCSMVLDLQDDAQIDHDPALVVIRLISCRRNSVAQLGDPSISGHRTKAGELKDDDVKRSQGMRPSCSNKYDIDARAVLCSCQDFTLRSNKPYPEPLSAAHAHDHLCMVDAHRGSSAISCGARLQSAT